MPKSAIEAENSLTGTRPDGHAPEHPGNAHFSTRREMTAAEALEAEKLRNETLPPSYADIVQERLIKRNREKAGKKGRA